jgi:hypothetical protein
MYSYKYNQKDATLYNIFYYCRCCTWFGRLLRPSSGAHELYTQHLVQYVPGLLAATASAVGLQPQLASGSSKQAWHVPDAVCTVRELLMMGGETARNM